MEILSDTTFRGEVNFNRNVTFANGTVLKFDSNGSFDGGSLVASEFVYNDTQGKITVKSGTNRSQSFRLPHFSQMTCTQFTNDRVALIANIPQAAELCKFIRAGQSGCFFYSHYEGIGEVSADCTFFSMSLLSFGISDCSYVADAKLFKIENFSNDGIIYTVWAPAQADVMIGPYNLYIRKASGLAIGNGEYAVKVTGLMATDRAFMLA